MTLTGNLEPRIVWDQFAQLTDIPRPSHHEERASAFVAEFGRGLGLETDQDAVGNVVIRKPASAGREHHPGIILQAHLDMVPEKAPGKIHDFVTDPITAFVDGDWVRADGTTLGADDGIGVAIILAVLQDDTLTHGPLEAIFTVNEEDGFTGVDAVQPGVLRGSVLINVDSECEGTFTIGSAGGADVDALGTYAEEPTPVGMIGVDLAITGLQGGHSGIDIHRGRGNAIKLLARTLIEAQRTFDVRVSSISGGGQYNAIPRTAAAQLAMTPTERAPFTAFIADIASTIRHELAETEPELQITATAAETATTVMTNDAQFRVVNALNGCPNGVIRMSDAVPGLVETSTNLGLVEAANGNVAAGLLVRSAVNSARDDLQESAISVFALAGIKAVRKDAFTGWKPNPISPILTLMQAVYQDQTGHPARVEAIHAGLETSEFGLTYPTLDMISIGPTIEHAHSPDERLEIATVGPVYDLLVATLRRTAELAPPPTRPNAGGPTDNPRLRLRTT